MDTQTAYTMTLNGKRIVVLGGTSGIGFATAEMAAREGATIVVASSRRESVDLALARLPKGTEMADPECLKKEHTTRCSSFFKHSGSA